MTDTDTVPCDWCGNEIEPDEELVRVVRGRKNEMGGTLATFHDDTCFGEIRDYGWA